MKLKNLTLATLALLCLLTLPPQLSTVFAQGTAFTCQGRLNEGSAAASGIYDLRFAIYDAASAGSLIAGPLTSSAVPVINGLFTTTLDFGSSPFTGAPRWMEVEVRTNGSGTFTALVPRQALTPAPYSVYAPNSGTALTAGMATRASSADTVAAADITGTLPDARLSANIPRLNGNAQFTGNLSGSTLASGGKVNWASGSMLSDDQGGSIELGNSLLTNTVPFIDFHYGLATDEDFNIRLINHEPGVLEVWSPPYTPLLRIQQDGSIVVDPANRNIDGGLVPGLTFGGGSGEGIASRRSGGNQWGLDFFTSFIPRLSIDNQGWVSIGKQNPSSILDVNGTVTATSFSGSGAGLTSLPAASLAGTVSVAQLPPAVLTNGASGITLGGTFMGDGSGVTNVGLGTLNAGGAVAWPGDLRLNSWLTALSGDSPGAVVAADVNRDSRQDICVAYFGGTIAVFTNSGNGAFNLASASAKAGQNPRQITAADVNGDGKLDLVTANSAPSTLTVLTNNGSGIFSVADSPSVGTSPYSVLAADLDGDGPVELVSANFGNDTLSILKKSTDGSFVVTSTVGVGAGPQWLTAADLDGDGKMDLVSANASGNSLTVLTNGGAGGFTLQATLSAGAPSSVLAVDLNADGRMDLLAAEFSNHQVRSWTNDGTGRFLNPYPLGVFPPRIGRPSALTAGYFNGDGRIDVVCSSQETNSVTVLTNAGTGVLVAASSDAVGSRPHSLSAADLNRDGRLDVVCGHLAVGENRAAVLFNSPTFVGQFAGDASSLILANNSVTTATIADGSVTSAKLASDVNSLAKVSGGFVTVDSGGRVAVDPGSVNNGAVTAAALSFGGNSGEGIASKRTAGGNQHGLDFYTFYVPRLRIDNSGKVGIGGTPGDALLDVQGNVRLNNNDIFLREGSDRNHGVGYYGIIRPFGSATPDGPVVYGWTGGALGTVGTGQNVVLSWNNSGRVGIGTTSPIFTLEVNGTAGKPGGGSWSVASDARLKKNILPLTGVLDQLLTLRGVTYEYVDPVAVHELDGQRIGMLAQEVEAVLPDWVETGADGFKRLTYRGFEALTVEALRELRAEKDREIKSRDAEIAQLKERVEKLERWFSKMVSDNIK
jgi:hypothetical protein